MNFSRLGFAATLAGTVLGFAHVSSAFILHDGTPGSGTAVWGYSPTAGGIDGNTTHLWHFEESSGNYLDSIDGVANMPLVVKGLSSRNGESLLEEEFAVNHLPKLTNDPNAYNVGVNTGIYAKTPVVGTGDNVTSDQADSLWGADGAFSWEAIIELDFPATTSIGAAANNMRIISAAGDSATDSSPMQFMFMPKNDDPSYPAGLTEARLVIGVGSEEITAFVPTTGPNAIADGAWYHVAATYNGNEGAADNMKLYWTRITGTTDTTTEANLLDPNGYLDNSLGAGNPKNSFNADPTRNGLTFDFGIGNRGGGSQTVGNFDGRMDEVRISTVARGAGEFLFASSMTQDGDYDFDGDVDAADYVVWRKTDGTQAGYDAWRTNFGATSLGSGSGLGSIAVPEPSALALVVFGGLTLCTSCRRQARPNRGSSPLRRVISCA
jgi:hypothetical protein